MGTKLNIEGVPEGTFRVFAGDLERGKCLQITLVAGAYIQLTEKQVLELAEQIEEVWTD
jgi:hypothetical protein